VHVIIDPYIVQYVFMLSLALTLYSMCSCYHAFV